VWQPWDEKQNHEFLPVAITREEGGALAMAYARNAEIPTLKSRLSFASLLLELKTELVEFVRTRTQLLFSEVRHKAEESKKSAVFGAIALIFGSVAFLLLTVAAVALVAVAFWGSPFTFFWGFLVIGLCYLLQGAIASIVAYFGLKSLAPQKTIKVLHDDKTWVRTELSRHS
jgi:uncharacterized membrane protein YqjE